MGIDTSIYNSLLQPPKSVADYDAEAARAQMNKLAVINGQNQQNEYQRGLASDNKLAQLLGQGAAPQDVATGLAQAGYGKASLAYTQQQQALAKTAADIGKTKADTGKLDMETVNMAVQQHRDALTTINTPQDAAKWVAATYADPRMAQVSAHGGTLQDALARIPTDPAAFAQWKQASMLGAEKLIQYTTPDANTVANNNTSITTTGMNNATSIRTTGMNNATTTANTASTNATTRRGQDMTNERAKDAQGNKPLTEFQGKSAAFGDRAIKADAILRQLDGKYDPAAINSKASVSGIPVLGGIAEAGVNNMMSPETQQAEQAQRDFVNAILRQESGAAIGQSEFDNARKQYFPQPGDSKEVKAQKAANRKTAIDGFVRSAGSNAGLSAAPKASGVPDDIAELLAKHGGK